MGTASDEIMVTVSETVADALETPIKELPPLRNAINPDALGAIVSSKTHAQPPDVTVTFEYAGLEVFVHSGGMVYAQPIGSVSDALVNR